MGAAEVDVLGAIAQVPGGAFALADGVQFLGWLCTINHLLLHLAHSVCSVIQTMLTPKGSSIGGRPRGS